MTLRFVDGFDHYALADVDKKWNKKGGYAEDGIVVGRNGNALQLRVSESDNYRIKAFDNQTTWYLGFAVRFPNGLPNGNFWSLCGVGDLDRIQVDVRVSSTGTLRLTRDGTVLVDSTQALMASAWNYVELKVVVNGTTGIAEVRVNGTVWATYTGNTQATANAYANQVYLGCRFYTGGWQLALYDDCYICDGAGTANNTYLGDVAVKTLLPNGVGGSAQFVATGAATNWQAVSEASFDADTSYVSSSTVGQTDTYALADLPANVTTVVGLQVTAMARKTDAGPRQLGAVVRPAATDYAGANKDLAGSYLAVTTVFEQNPATAAAWTLADVNGLAAGAKVAN